jgi:hypothetical protein
MKPSIVPHPSQKPSLAPSDNGNSITPVDIPSGAGTLKPTSSDSSSKSMSAITFCILAVVHFTVKQTHFF